MEKVFVSDFEGIFLIDSISVGEHTISVFNRMYLDTIEIQVDIKKDIELFIEIEYPKCEYTNNSKCCPACQKKKDVIPIVYGLPSSGLIEYTEEGNVILGGCSVTHCDPSWYCKKG